MIMENLLKQSLFDSLDQCLISLGSYDSYSLMPLLYVLVAHHEGHNVSIVGDFNNVLLASKQHLQDLRDVDGYESELLREIRTSVDQKYFEDESAQIVFDFFSSWNDLFNSYYSEIIEHIISYYSTRAGVYAGMSITPVEVSELMANLIANCKPTGIFDPFAGFCSSIMQSELSGIAFLGQELIHYIEVIAKVRLDAAQIKNATIINGDSTCIWNNEDKYDTLASEVPFGVCFTDNSCVIPYTRYLEDYVLEKFINTPSLKKAVLLMASGTCFRQGETAELRKQLCEKNWVDAVIMLPAGILPYAGINTSILILNKERTNQEIKFILANDCTITDGKRKILDFKGVLERFYGKDNKQSVTIHVDETFRHDCSFLASLYISEKIDVLPGQQIVKFMSLVTKIQGEQIDDQINKEIRGRVLDSKYMFGNIADFQTRSSSIETKVLTKQSYRLIYDKALIFNVKADKFFIKKDEEPLFVSSHYSCFIVDEKKCLPEYLADCVVKNKRIRKAVLKGSSIRRIDWDNLYLPIYSGLESQHQIVMRIYREESKALQKKIDTLKLLGGRSSDLLHNLGATFTKISASIDSLKYDFSSAANYQMHIGDRYRNNNLESLNAMDDNIQFALRQINSTGTDFAFTKPELEKVNLFNTLDQYVRAWENFGFQSFDVLPIKSDVSKDTKVEIDTNLFYIMLDCIFINAHQHGFNKRYNQDNKVLIKLEGVIYKENEYIRIAISNNGNPLPDNFSVKDFSERGVVGINSSQDGVGGDHVSKISHLFGGLISIDSDSLWLTFNILLPVYLTSENTKFYDYENECI